MTPVEKVIRDALFAAPRTHADLCAITRSLGMSDEDCGEAIDLLVDGGDVTSEASDYLQADIYSIAVRG